MMNNNSRKRKQLSKPPTPGKHDDEHQVIETDPLVTERIFNFLSSLPPGYRFMPTDVELIRDYLRPKIAKQTLPLCLIHPVNLYRYHPRTLAEKYLKHPNGEEVYYFTPRDRKYKNGTRPSRGVDGIGYWKATGSDGRIEWGEELIGFTKTLVFYEGKAPSGKKTNWIMHEYRTCESRKRTSNEDMKLDDWVLCQIREKVDTPNKNKKDKDGTDGSNNAGGSNDNDGRDNNGEDKMNTNVSDTNSTNAMIGTNVVKDEEDTFGKATVNICSTSYQNQNDIDQYHQEMRFPSPQDSLYPLNTCRGNFNMINDNYALGSFMDELSCVPGTSYSNKFQTKGPDFYDIWEQGLTCDIGFDCWSTYLDSFNFQDSTSDLNIMDSSNFQNSSSDLNIKNSNFQDSSRVNINNVDDEKQKLQKS